MRAALICAAIVAAQIPTQAAPVCAPMINAAGHPLAPRWETGTFGKHMVLMCTDALQSKTFPGGLSCLHADCNVNTFGAAVLKIMHAEDRQKAMDEEWAAGVKWTCDAAPTAAKANLCTERAELIRTNWAKWSAGHAVSVWRVKANGAATTRPAYALVNGVLGTKEVARATVGATCNVARPTAPATGGDIRAEFGPANAAGVVTICSKQ